MRKQQEYKIIEGTKHASSSDQETCSAASCSQEKDDQFLSPSDVLEQAQYPSSDEEAYGLDLDALEMTIDDELPPPEIEDEYGSIDYLQKCRRRLIFKVKKYKEKNETLRTENINLIAKHREEVEAIRSFYQNISFGLSRTGKMVRTALCNGKELQKKFSKVL
jgi:hypothetical protein